jgi:hypothetical protein
LTFHYQEHHIQLNLTVVDSKVYGDVEFWIMITENKQTILLIMDCRFGISTGTSEQYKDGEIAIHSIFTWDVINS